MGFDSLPVPVKYTIIFSIILTVTIALLLVRYVWFRRKEHKAWKRLHKDAEDAIEMKYDNTGYVAPSQAVPINSPPPQTVDNMMEAPNPQVFNPHHDFRHSDVVPQPVFPKYERPPKPPYVQHRRNESARTARTDLSHVPTIFNVRSPEQPLLARRRRSYSDSYRDSRGVSYPVSSVTKSSAALPPSPFAYSPAVYPDDDGGITSPRDDDVYVRAPRLYNPPIMAYGSADLPFFHRRNMSKSSRRSQSLSRSRSVSMTSLPKLLRMPTNFSITSNGSRAGRRAHERAGSYDEWIDTLTVIDDNDMYDLRGSPDSIKPMPLFAGRGNSRRLNGASRHRHNRSASTIVNIGITDIIAEERESFSERSSSAGCTTPRQTQNANGAWNDGYYNNAGYQNGGYQDTGYQNNGYRNTGYQNKGYEIRESPRSQEANSAQTPRQVREFPSAR